MQAETIDIEVQDSEATDFLMACLEEWQGMGGDNTEMFEAMDEFVTAVKMATTTKH